MKRMKEMEQFDRFPRIKICPICGTNKEGSCVLVPIYGTYNDTSKACKAIPVHSDCLETALHYYPHEGLILAKANHGEEGA